MRRALDPQSTRWYSWTVQAIEHPAQVYRVGITMQRCDIRAPGALGAVLMFKLISDPKLTVAADVVSQIQPGPRSGSAVGVRTHALPY